MSIIIPQPMQYLTRNICNKNNILKIPTDHLINNMSYYDVTNFTHEKDIESNIILVKFYVGLTKVELAVTDIHSYYIEDELKFEYIVLLNENGSVILGSWT